eukprot:COSAG02_NODE_32710_length_512_cov_0.489104_1_plen_111_part_01
MAPRFALLLLLVPAPATSALGPPVEPLSCFAGPLTGEAKDSMSPRYGLLCVSAGCARKRRKGEAWSPTTLITGERAHLALWRLASPLASPWPMCFFFKQKTAYEIMSGDWS